MTNWVPIAVTTLLLVPLARPIAVGARQAGPITKQAITFNLVEASIPEMQAALASGRVTRSA